MVHAAAVLAVAIHIVQAVKLVMAVLVLVRAVVRVGNAKTALHAVIATVVSGPQPLHAVPMPATATPAIAKPPHVQVQAR